jgi:hypothetical protein
MLEAAAKKLGECSRLLLSKAVSLVLVPRTQDTQHCIEAQYSVYQIRELFSPLVADPPCRVPPELIGADGVGGSDPGRARPHQVIQYASSNR